ncbi:DNA-directed RNA polymerase, partial [Coemansia sp. RSA 1933]
LHIHQDGTCNGLQHYAAMGRDIKGAKEVNLYPSDRPQDVYSGILNVVIRRIDEDIEKGVEHARKLQNHLTRKVVKQTVMTNVYGVTLIGAKEQIANRLRELEDSEGNLRFGVLEVNGLAMYVARKIFESLGEMFTQAQQIQNWLNEAASRIAKSMPAAALVEWKERVAKDKEAKVKLNAAKRAAKDNGGVLDVDTILEIRPDLGPGSKRRKRMDKLSTKPMTTVTWTTPIGLTVTQPYRRLTHRQITTQLQSIAIYDTHMPSPVNSQKQKTAFPPNFVHSLDAAHMVLSAIQCKVAGLVFASVHDSYWTHACDIDKMNDILREQFVQLHECDIMVNLKSELEKRYAGHKMPIHCWQYVSIPPTVEKQKKTGASAAAAASGGESDLSYDQILESSLASYQLRICEDDDMSQEQSSDQTSADADSPITGDHVRLVDLNSIELIDPKKDLEGALKQEDCIAYTIATNIATKKKQQASIAAAYKKKLSAAKRLARKIANSKTAASASAADATESEKNEGIVMLEKLEREKAEKLAEVEASTITELKRKPIMVPRSQVKSMYKDVAGMKSQLGVSGKFTSRMLWVDMEFDQLPENGDFDIKQVRNSLYFFS